jgi:hypothetical protein
MLTIVIEGSDEFLSKLHTFAKDVEDAVEEEITMAIDEIYNRAQLLAPTDLAGGAGIRSTAYKEVTKLQGEVGYNSLLAAYHEFGTGAFVDIPPGLEAYAMTFFVNGKGRIPANAFLFPSFYSVAQEFGPNVMASINRIWKK